jgi:hypothetical protein
MAREGSAAQPSQRPMKIETSFMCLQNHPIVIGGAILPFLPSWFAPAVMNLVGGTISFVAAAQSV